MPNLFKAIIGIAAFHNSQSPNLASIDTSVDRLHYRFTAGILFLSTTLLGLNDIFGKPIMCKSQVKLKFFVLTVLFHFLNLYTFEGIMPTEELLLSLETDLFRILLFHCKLMDQ